MSLRRVWGSYDVVVEVGGGLGGCDGDVDGGEKVEGYGDSWRNYIYPSLMRLHGILRVFASHHIMSFAWWMAFWC